MAGFGISWSGLRWSPVRTGMTEIAASARFTRHGVASWSLAFAFARVPVGWLRAHARVDSSWFRREFGGCCRPGRPVAWFTLSGAKLRLNVVVHAKYVLGIVSAFHRNEPLVIWPARC